MSRIVYTLVLICVTALPAAAQTVPGPVPGAAPADTTRPQASPDTAGNRLTPRSAFIRSLIIPGWGQAKAGAYKRGGIFFGIQSASWYMLLKTLAKLGDAREIEANHVAFVTDSLNARAAQDTAFANQIKDPVKFQEHVDDYEPVEGIRALIESREQQRQDWITYTIFFTLASGVDAYVAAHLSDFPATITTRPSAGGGLQLQLSIPVQRKP